MTPRIVLCMPTTAHRAGSVDWALHFRLLPLPYLHRVIVRSDYRVDMNREALAEAALAVPGATHLLWWDDDIWPAREGIRALLRHQYPITAGPYRDKQGRPSLMRWHNGRHDRVDRLQPPGPGQHLYADAVGLGWCLMDLRIFRAVPRPWFQFAADLGEDCYFFAKVHDVWRIPVLVDGDAACGHEMPVRLTVDNATEPVWSGLGQVVEVSPPA